VAARSTTSAPEAPAELAEVAERRQLVLDALSTLPPKDRLVIACRYLLELTEAETVAVTGWPAGTVKSRLSRALRRLQDELVPRLAFPLEVPDA
jgi:RNA polymerase sigma-70 factor (ECF subfamily)